MFMGWVRGFGMGVGMVIFDQRENRGCEEFGGGEDGYLYIKMGGEVYDSLTMHYKTCNGYFVVFGLLSNAYLFLI